MPCLCATVVCHCCLTDCYCFKGGAGTFKGDLCWRGDGEEPNKLQENDAHDEPNKLASPSQDGISLSPRGDGMALSPKGASDSKHDALGSGNSTKQDSVPDSVPSMQPTLRL